MGGAVGPAGCPGGAGGGGLQLRRPPQKPLKTLKTPIKTIENHEKPRFSAVSEAETLDVQAILTRFEGSRLGFSWSAATRGRAFHQLSMFTFAQEAYEEALKCFEGAELSNRSP